MTAELLAVDGFGAAWIAVAAALGSALITTGGAAWLQSGKAKTDAEAAKAAHARESESQNQAFIKAASEKLMISAIRIHHFAQGLRDLMVQHSGASVGKLTRDWLVFQIDQHDRTWRCFNRRWRLRRSFSWLLHPMSTSQPICFLMRVSKLLTLQTPRAAAAGQHPPQSWV